MTSLKQFAANRQNALKSTGPITAEGKERSRLNSIRHGLTAETVIGGLEDAEDYQAFEQAVTADYDAETAVERELVLRLASVLWRLRRATGIESALFELVADRPNQPDQQQGIKPAAILEIASLSEQSRLVLVEGHEHRALAASSLDPATDRKAGIAAAFLRLADLPTFPLDRLSRYEHLLWRQARQLAFTLESLRRRRSPPNRSRISFGLRRRPIP